MRIVVTHLTKEYNHRPVFRGLSFSVNTNDSLAITGRNGSGKSTLIKILAGVLSPTRGTVRMDNNGTQYFPSDVRDAIGLVSPHIQMYDEFSAVENLDILFRIRTSRMLPGEEFARLLERYGLWERRNELVRTYSSGMKQRLKYVFALLHKPAVLLLDEPTANLDAEGIKVVQQLVQRQKKSGTLVMATNSATEARWCKKKIHLGG